MSDDEDIMNWGSDDDTQPEVRKHSILTHQLDPSAPPPQDLRDDDTAKAFMCCRPWTDVVLPPPEWVPEEGYLEAPKATLQLEHAFGYTAVGCRNNAHWVNAPDVLVFPVAAVGVIYKVSENKQTFYVQHRDDIVCMDYHSESRVVCSGSIGNPPQLCIWKINTDNTPEHKFDIPHAVYGKYRRLAPPDEFQHQRAVSGVAINPQGTLVASFGLDDNHCVAVHDIETGNLMYSSPGTKTRLIDIKYLTVSYVDSSTQFVTVGDKEILFWCVEPGAGAKNKPKEPEKRPGELEMIKVASDTYPMSDDGLKSVGCTHRNVALYTCTSVVSTSHCVVVGTAHGDFFVIHDPIDKFSQRAIAPPRIEYIDVPHNKNENPKYNSCFFSLTPTLDPDVYISGSRSGRIEYWKMEAKPEGGPPGKIQQSFPYNATIIETVDANMWHEATDNDSDVLVNSVKSISIQNGYILAGTILSHLFVHKEKSKEKAKIVVEGHWGNLRDADGYGELWAIDTHPILHQACSGSEDGTIRLWDLEANKLLEMYFTKRRIRSICYSPDASIIAVGFYNGAFGLYNPDCLHQPIPGLPPYIRRRRRRIQTIKFSPNSQYLIVCPAEMSADVYRVSPLPMAFLGKLKGNSSAILSVDWNESSTVVQTTSHAYEMLFYHIPTCQQITSSRAMSMQKWYTYSAPVGWTVQGIWPPGSNGSDINTVSLSNSKKLVITGDDSGNVKMFRYPCVGGGRDYRQHVSIPTLRPEFNLSRGHSSHVTDCGWAADDSYVITGGGHDLTIFKWKLVYPNDKLPEIPELEIVELPATVKLARSTKAGYSNTANPSSDHDGGCKSPGRRKGNFLRLTKAIKSARSSTKLQQEALKQHMATQPSKVFQLYSLESFSTKLSRSTKLELKPKAKPAWDSTTTPDFPSPPISKKTKHFPVDFRDY